MIPILIALAHAAATPVCEVTGAASAEDFTRAHAACAVARARFAELFGGDAPELLIVLKPEAGYRVTNVGTRAIVLWPVSEANTPSGLEPDRAARHVAVQWSDVLPHESMHALVLARFFSAGPSEGDGYGTSLPDWFEEAIAIWAEPHESRRIRLRQARALPAEQQDLRAILASRHPAAAQQGLLAARDGAALPRDNAALWAFYPQALAVLTFVHDAGGGGAVRELLERLLAGVSDLDALAGLPGLARDGADVVRAWHEWLGTGSAAPGPEPSRRGADGRRTPGLDTPGDRQPARE